MRKGDTWPPIKATLKEVNGDVIDLTGADVDFRMEDEDEVEVINRQATITDEANGEVEFYWNTGDTDTLGKYDAEFIVTFDDGKVAHVPNNDTITIYITDH